MNLIEFGESPPRNAHCWSAIRDGVLSWEVKIADAVVHARFGDDPSVLQLVLVQGGRALSITELDISWIAYADQAYRFELLTRKALNDLERAISVERGSELSISSTN